MCHGKPRIAWANLNKLALFLTVRIAITVAECGYQCRANRLCQPVQCNASHAYAIGAPEKGPLFLYADKYIQ